MPIQIRVKNRSFCFVLALVGLVIAKSPNAAHADSDTYAKAVGSTVWIVTSDADGETSTGSGALVDLEKRLIMTNAHVVGECRTAVVFFPVIQNGEVEVKRQHYLDNVVKLAQPGKVVAVDRRRDLALIQLPAVPEGVKALELAEASAKPGANVDIIGNPGGSDVLWVNTAGTVRSVYAKKFKSDHGDHDFRAVEIQSRSSLATVAAR